MIDSVSQLAGGLSDLRGARRVRPKATDDSLGQDRLPPHSDEMERGVLGCILLSPNECLPHVIEAFGNNEVFYDLRHQTIYAAMIEMYDKREPIDIITVQQRLKDHKLLEQIGGIPFLNALQDSVPSAANVTYYTSNVFEKYQLRKWVSASTSVVGKIYEFEGDCDTLLDELERDTIKLIDSRSGSKPQRTAKDLVHGATAIMEKAVSGFTGIQTGFPDLDRMTCGLMPADMVVIAARPSVGKTSLAMNIAEHVAINSKIPVGVFSLEMTGEMLMLRALCSVARVDFQSVRQGYITGDDAPKLASAAGKLAKAPLHIDDSSGLSIIQLRAKARRMVQLHGVKLFVIDYLQLLSSPSKGRDDSRQQEVTRISSGIKAMAKELGVPVIVLAQLNRDLEKGAGKKTGSRRPRISDLRESGAIEQDADIIGLLYRPDDDPESQLVDLDIAKQRNGPTGVVNLVFHKNHTRFESASKVTAEDVP